MKRNMQRRKLNKFLLQTLAGILFCSFVLTQSSCTGNPQNDTAPKIYFDVPGFFNQQIAQLYKDSFVVIKTAQIDENTDQHEMRWTDWKKEFALFFASDINKASFAGKYKVDSVNTDSSTRIITYAATDPSLRTRLIEITRDARNNDIRLLHITNQTSNFLSSNNEELYYEPMKSYIIKSSQQMRFFGENTFAVKGDIVLKQPQYFEQNN